MTDKKELELIVVKENWLGSIVSDCFTFAIMILAFWINYTYIGNSIMMQLIITVTIVAWALNYCKSAHIEIRGRENIIKFLREFEAKE